MKPILFNTEMVKAILDGRKTVTRRCIKPKYNNTHFEYRHDKYGVQLVEMQNDEEGVTYGVNEDGSHWRSMKGFLVPKPKYAIGDILYVRETFGSQIRHGGEFLVYKANEHNAMNYDVNAKGSYPTSKVKWKPSIHMPKEEARIFLRVTDVRIERLQDITDKQAIKEGVWTTENACPFSVRHVEHENTRTHVIAAFSHVWNSTLKQDELDKYGWDANPYVFVYEFEIISKDEAYARDC